MTYNVLYGAAGREDLVRAVVQAVHPDVAIFTEARATPAFEAVADVVGAHHVSAGSPNDRECIVIASRWPIVRSERFGPRWAPLKWLGVTTQPPFGATVTVVGAHLAPHLLWPFEVLRRHEIAALLKHLHEARPHVVAGDFNALSVGDSHRLNRAASWVRAQLILQAGSTPRWALRRLIEAGYLDCYRACNPGSDGFTIPAWDPQARIDYLFASRGLESALRSSGVAGPAVPRTARADPRRTLAQLLGRTPLRSLNGEASDHLPVWADFEWNEESAYETLGRQPPIREPVKAALEPAGDTDLLRGGRLQKS